MPGPELELFCDGVALQTLARMGAASSALIDGLRIMHALPTIRTALSSTRPATRIQALTSAPGSAKKWRSDLSLNVDR